MQKWTKRLGTRERIRSLSADLTAEAIREQYARLGALVDARIHSDGDKTQARAMAILEDESLAIEDNWTRQGFIRLYKQIRNLE